MRIWRSIVVVAVVALAGAAAAAPSKAPGGQGKACGAKSACATGLSCVQHAGRNSTCEIVCAANTKCPEDQRCVNDGGQMTCRPITDL